ncbi:MAG: UDP-N-acetylglucosamine 2-epimerase (non-hydrolyzing) [Balneolaceae bacterium]
MKIISVVGARPNFMKVAPLSIAFKKYQEIEHKIVHTGQHYDYSMNKLFFEQLGIPDPDTHLNVGSGSHAKQTAEIMSKFEDILIREKPDYVLVVGDVNSTLACSLVASKMHIKVIHVESGLRSNDRKMPEELNRIVTDNLSDILFVSEESGLINLEREGIPSNKVHFVGNVMIDSLIRNLENADKSDVMSKSGLDSQSFGLVTLHRPSNVDTKESLEKLVRLLSSISDNHKLVFPMHPRTKNNLSKFGLLDSIQSKQNIQVLEPQGYFEFLKLMKECLFVLTDSGGVQEETTYLNVPCITIRDNTERPVTCTLGTNTLVLFKDIDQVEDILASKLSKKKNEITVPYWDGKTATRIAEIIIAHFESIK